MEVSLARTIYPLTQFLVERLFNSFFEVGHPIVVGVFNIVEGDPHLGHRVPVQDDSCLQSSLSRSSMVWSQQKPKMVRFPLMRRSISQKVSVLSRTSGSGTFFTELKSRDSTNSIVRGINFSRSNSAVIEAEKKQMRRLLGPS